MFAVRLCITTSHYRWPIESLPSTCMFCTPPHCIKYVYTRQGSTRDLWTVILPLLLSSFVSSCHSFSLPFMLRFLLTSSVFIMSRKWFDCQNGLADRVPSVIAELGSRSVFIQCSFSDRWAVFAVRVYSVFLQWPPNSFLAVCFHLHAYESEVCMMYARFIQTTAVTITCFYKLNIPLLSY
jgi:hypothetical protein